MRDAYDTICDIAGEKLADLVCCENPARVFEGDDVKGGLVGKTATRSRQKRSKKTKYKTEEGLRIRMVRSLMMPDVFIFT